MTVLTACAALLSTGCYTQLYTQGHLERAGSGYPQYAGAPDPRMADPSQGPADSIAGDSTVARPDGVEGDTLYRPGTVIVNNYYRESPVYRGYAISEWDYPFISFGFYGARYRDYYGPYWWNDPWYHHRRRGSGYHGGHYHGGHYQGGHSGNHGGSPGSGSSGPYKSDKRLFADPPAQKPGKGRRAAPQYESYSPPAEKSGSSQPAPSSSSGGSGSSSPSGESASGSSKEESKPSKGRRR